MPEVLRRLFSIPLWVAVLLEVACVGGITWLQAMFKVDDVPDLWITGFAPQTLHDLFSGGPEWRAGYLRLELFDLFPYMWGYTILFGHLLQRFGPFHSAAWIPIIILVTDIVENVLIITLLQSWHPDMSHTWESIARVVSLAVQIKWMLVAVAIICLIVGVLRVLFGRRDGSSKKKT